jgi:hypothetical protein
MLHDLVGGCAAIFCETGISYFICVPEMASLGKCRKDFTQIQKRMQIENAGKYYS